MPEPQSPIEPVYNVLAEFLLEIFQEEDGRVRIEEVISAAAAIVGEKCIEAAGDFDPLGGQFVPGVAIMSDKVNELISGNELDWAKAPPLSIVWLLRLQLLGKGYEEADLPSLERIFKGFAARIGDGRKESFGRAPLSIPQKHQPDYPPLKFAFDTRKEVNHLLREIGDKRERLQTVTLALARILFLAKDVLDRRVALRLALDTVNAMAKTAPLTEEAWSEAAKEVEAATIAATKSERPWWRFW